MASLGHVAIGLAAGRWFSSRRGSAPARAMVAFSVASLLPDADVISFALGIPYGAPFGHRGASHALFTALLCGLIAGVACAIDSQRAPARTGLVAGLVTATHGPLDALTDGGRGVALLWPLSNARIFFPWRPLPVAPIGIGLASREGLEVLGFELIVFLPFLLYALLPRRR